MVIFDHAQIDWGKFAYLIRLRLGFWLRSWKQNCPYSPGEVVHNLECVKSWKEKKIERPAIVWCPPPLNKIKWNVDGFSRGKPSLAGIGGILRNAQGTTRAMFAALVGIRDSNEAKLFGNSFCT